MIPMMADRPHVRTLLRTLAAASVAGAAALVATTALAATASVAVAAPQAMPRYAGSYVMTHVTGATVVRMELLLEANGRARLKSGGGRYTQRPTGVDATQTVESGTWRSENGRLVLHIEKYESTAQGRSDEKPDFEDRTFVLAGCELRLVGASTAFTFDKKNCS